MIDKKANKRLVRVTGLNDSCIRWASHRRGNATRVLVADECPSSRKLKIRYNGNALLPLNEHFDVVRGPKYEPDQRIVPMIVARGVSRFAQVAKGDTYMIHDLAETHKQAAVSYLPLKQ